MGNLECEIMAKVDNKEIKFQLMEMLNEKADKFDVEKLKASKVDSGAFEAFKSFIQEHDRFGRILITLTTF